ncbi:MAG: hypothetical protein H0W88_08745 [Parachlamydiaceae bacterium]|nr:hypothetical protein [Parachlamydiaceae bacterium]
MILFKKTFFTLLELLIVLLLLSFGMALTGIKVKEAYAEQRFYTEVEQVLSHLQLAQDIMLIMEIDVTVQFFKDKSDKDIHYRIVPEKPVSPKLKVILAKEYILKSIRNIDFIGDLRRKEEGIILDFFSRGMSMSKGKLNLFEKDPPDNGKAFQITFAGYPTFLASEKYKEYSREQSPLEELKKQDLYPKILLNGEHDKVPE